MPKAIWNDVVIAETEAYEMVEGNIYFPPESVNSDYLKPSDSATHCPWKGDAHYYTLDVCGKTLEDAAWYYPTPLEKAANIKDHIAFWKGVLIEQ